MSVDKYKNFDQTMRALFKVLKEVIDFKASLKLLGKKDGGPILKLLQRYEKAYDLTAPEEHIEDVLAVYNKFKAPILKSSMEDKWLLDNTVIMQFGESTMKIMLSSIYLDARKLKDETMEKCKGLPEEVLEARKEILFCDWIRLYLYKLFRLSLEEKDKKEDTKKLFNLIVELETEMGVDSQKKIDEAFGGASSGTSSGANGANPMAGIFDMAKNMLSKMGMQVPNDIQMPNQSDIGTMMNSVLQNPQMKDMMNNLGGGAGGKPADIGSIFQNLLSTLTTNLPQNQQVSQAQVQVQTQAQNNTTSTSQQTPTTISIVETESVPVQQPAEQESNPVETNDPVDITISNVQEITNEVKNTLGIDFEKKSE